VIDKGHPFERLRSPQCQLSSLNMHRPAGAEHGAELFKLQVPADERSAVRAQRLRSALRFALTTRQAGTGSSNTLA
jgi:hypothetical protein